MCLTSKGEEEFEAFFTKFWKEGPRGSLTLWKIPWRVLHFYKPVFLKVLPTYIQTHRHNLPQCSFSPLTITLHGQKEKTNFLKIFYLVKQYLFSGRRSSRLWRLHSSKEEGGNWHRHQRWSTQIAQVTFIWHFIQRKFIFINWHLIFLLQMQQFFHRSIKLPTGHCFLKTSYYNVQLCS